MRNSLEKPKIISDIHDMIRSCKYGLYHGRKIRLSGTKGIFISLEDTGKLQLMSKD